MAGSIDFSELNNFYKNMKVTEGQYNKFLKEFLIESGELVIGKAKENTPVDTGALKASWGIQTEETVPYETELYSGYYGKKIPKTLYRRIGGKIAEGVGTSMSIVLSNPQEYATQIEEGFIKNNGEWYEGKYMLKRAIEQVRVAMPSNYNIKLDEFKTKMRLK